MYKTKLKLYFCDTMWLYGPDQLAGDQIGIPALYEQTGLKD